MVQIKLDKTLLKKDLKLKRGKTPLRTASEENGIDHSTLSRMENGSTPDLINFMKACRWMGNSPWLYMKVYESFNPKNEK